MTDWWPTPTVQRLVIAVSDGKIYKEVNRNIDAVTLATGLSDTARGIFVTAGSEDVGRARKLFYFNGYNSPRVLSADGVVATAIALPPSDWTGTAQPSFGLVANNMLFAFGNSNTPHRVYTANAADHEDFQDASVTQFVVYPGVGERLVAGVGTKTMLILWKYPVGMYVVDISNSNPSYWKVDQLTDAIGCADHHGAVLPIATGDVLWLTPAGTFHLLSAFTTGGVEGSNLTDAMNLQTWIKANVNLDRLDQVTSVWYDDWSTAIFHLPGIGSEENNLRLIFDFSDKAKTGKVKVAYSLRDIGNCSCMRKDDNGTPMPAIGGIYGDVWLLWQDDRNKDGFGYTASYTIPETDFAFADPGFKSSRKTFAELVIYQNPQPAGSATVQVYFDNTLKHTKTIPLTRRRVRVRIPGSGYTFKATITNSVVNQNMSIVSHEVWLKPSGER